MPRIIFITELTLWSMGKGHGGPAFTQTVKKYIDEGWDVYLISDEPGNAGFPSLDQAHNIVLPLTRFSKLGEIRKVGILFRYLEQLSSYIRFSRCCDRILRKDHTDTIIYAYELLRFFPARRCSQKYHLPLVTRFQGTKLIAGGPHTLLQKIRCFPTYQATAFPSDLVIMTDDGTQGDRVLRELGNTSPTLFLRNGLDLMGWDIPARIAAFDTASFRAALGIGTDETMFLTVSRLENWKRVERAINGFAEFCRSGRAGQLVIVGDGASRTELEMLASSLGVAGRVLFTGSVAHDAVYDYMMAADVFLSLYDLSNVGNPLLEAMTLGKCVITLDVGDTRSLIHDRENGILLTMETLPTLGAIMLELAERPALRQQLGAAAAEYAQENFYTWQKRMDLEFQAVKALLKHLCMPNIRAGFKFHSKNRTS